MQLATVSSPQSLSPVPPSAGTAPDVAGDGFADALQQARLHHAAPASKAQGATAAGRPAASPGSKAASGQAAGRDSSAPADAEAADATPPGKGRAAGEADGTTRAPAATDAVATAPTPSADTPPWLPPDLAAGRTAADAPIDTDLSTPATGALAADGGRGARGAARAGLADVGPASATQAADSADSAADAHAARAEAAALALDDAAGAASGGDTVAAATAGGRFAQALQAAGGDATAGSALSALTTLAAPSGSPAAASADPATAPLAEHEIRTPLHSPGFAPALGAQLTLLVKEGVTEARLHLNPAEMGPIAVQIQLDGAQARVEMVAEQAATRQVLEQSMPSLASALRESGLTLAGGGVFEQSSRRDQAGDTDARGQRAPGAGAHGDAAAGTDGADAHVAGAPRAAPARGVVDLYA